MKSLILTILANVATLAIAHEGEDHSEASETSSMSMSGSTVTSSIPSMSITVPASVSTAAYSITALPAVIAQPACVWNCLIPIGLADPSGCDDVTNECACLSAPADVLDVLTGCISTVCTESQSAYAASVTSLYESYCTSAFGSMQFQIALTSEAAAAATSSILATATNTASAATASESESGSASASATGSSAASLVVPGALL